MRRAALTQRLPCLCGCVCVQLEVAQPGGPSVAHLTAAIERVDGLLEGFQTWSAQCGGALARQVRFPVLNQGRRQGAGMDRAEQRQLDNCHRAQCVAEVDGAGRQHALHATPQNDACKRARLHRRRLSWRRRWRRRRSASRRRCWRRRRRPRPPRALAPTRARAARRRRGLREAAAAAAEGRGGGRRPRADGRRWAAERATGGARGAMGQEASWTTIPGQCTLKQPAAAMRSMQRRRHSRPGGKQRSGRCAMQRHAARRRETSDTPGS